MKSKIMAGFAALVLSVAGAVAFAQQDQNQANQPGQGDNPAQHEQMMQRHFDKMAQELNLTEQQKPQVEAIMKSMMEKQRALRQQQEAQMKQLHESTQAELSKVLTPDQMTKMQAMHNRMREGGMHGKHGMHGGGPDGDAPPAPPKQ